MDIKNFSAVGGAIKSVLATKLLKKVAAVLIIGAFCAVGGAYYLHQQKQAKKILAAQARTTVIEVQAKEKSLSANRR